MKNQGPISRPRLAGSGSSQASMGTMISTPPADSTKLVHARRPEDGAVPEPATWALMILGVGLAGASLRTRGKTTAA